MTRRTLMIGIATVVAAVAMAVVFVSSASGAAKVQAAPAAQVQAVKADYGLGADCPLGGHDGL